MEIVRFEYEKKEIKNFINLSHKIYNKFDNMQNDNELKKLLLGEHILNNYFKFYKFNVYFENKIVGRFTITIYPNDTCAYLGFIEFIDDKDVSNYLFSQVDKFAKENNYTEIIGPVDASFWLKYRLKINKFELPYTSEPYNKEYYYNHYINNGYKVIEHYVSNCYDEVYDEYSSPKYQKHFADFINQGYKILSPTKNDWDRVIEEIYMLITDLYSDFPIFKDIDKNDFTILFNDYKKIIDYSMIKLAYFNGEAVGFFISIPNYNNIVYNSMSIKKLYRIFKIRNKPCSYVMLYMGVAKNHQGLGKALVQTIMDTLKEKKVPSIGALIRDGKITKDYAKDLINDKYEYVLLRKEL